MICDKKERTGLFPFDVSHRTIVGYTPESPRDFEALQTEITSRLQALLKATTEAQTMASIESSAMISGLSPHEMAALQIVMENQLSETDTMAASEVQSQMVQAGFTKIAATLSLRLLKNRDFVESVEEGGDFNNTWWCYRVTQIGVEWLLANQNQFQLRRHAESPRRQSRASEAADLMHDIKDDDVPF